MEYKIVNIRQMLKRNHGSDINYLVYAELRDQDNHIVISATLEYIVQKIKERRYKLMENS